MQKEGPDAGQRGRGGGREPNRRDEQKSSERSTKAERQKEGWRGASEARGEEHPRPFNLACQTPREFHPCERMKGGTARRMDDGTAELTCSHLHNKKMSSRDEQQRPFLTHCAPRMRVLRTPSGSVGETNRHIAQQRRGKGGKGQRLVQHSKHTRHTHTHTHKHGNNCCVWDRCGGSAHRH